MAAEFFRNCRSSVLASCGWVLAAVAKLLTGRDCSIYSSALASCSWVLAAVAKLLTGRDCSCGGSALASCSWVLAAVAKGRLTEAELGFSRRSEAID